MEWEVLSHRIGSLLKRVVFIRWISRHSCPVHMAFVLGKVGNLSHGKRHPPMNGRQVLQTRKTV